MAPPSRFADITEYTRLAASTARDIADSVNVPYLRATANLSLTIVEAVQVSRHERSSARVLTHRSLYSTAKTNSSEWRAISTRSCAQLSIYLRATTQAGSLLLRCCTISQSSQSTPSPLLILSHFRLTVYRTLQKIYIFIRRCSRWARSSSSSNKPIIQLGCKHAEPNFSKYWTDSGCVGSWEMDLSRLIRILVGSDWANDACKHRPGPEGRETTKRGSPGIYIRTH